MFGCQTLNVCRRNLKTFQTQSFSNTHKVISNNKYRNWRKICQFLMWGLATMPLPSEELEGGKRGTSALPAFMIMSCTASSREFKVVD